MPKRVSKEPKQKQIRCETLVGAMDSLCRYCASSAYCGKASKPDSLSMVVKCNSFKDKVK